MSHESLRVRLLLAFVLVEATAVGAVGVFLLLVGPGYFADAMGLPGGSMGLAMDAVARDAFAHALERALQAAILIATGTAAIVSFAVATRLARPMTRLAGAARRLAAGHYAERVADDEQGELRDLSESFNEMAQSLVIPLTFLVRLSGDRTLLGPLAASRRYSFVLWVMTAGLLALGLTSVVGVVGRVL